MFYESDSVDAILKCAFCSAKFTHDIKLVPNCGSSICGPCYQTLVNSLDAANHFSCRECKSRHVMPAEGLSDNRVLMKMLALKPKKKVLSYEEKMLKLMIGIVREKISAVKTRDDRVEIETYCESLEIEAITSIESAIQHLNQLRERFVGEIRQYRSDMLNWRYSLIEEDDSANNSTRSASTQHELDSLAKEVDDFRKKWMDSIGNINKPASNQEILRAQAQTKEFGSRVEKIKSSLQAELFNGRFLRFKDDGFRAILGQCSSALQFESPSNGRESSCLDVKLLNNVPFSSKIRSLILLKNNIMVTCHTSKIIKIWDLESGRLVHNFSSGFPYITSFVDLNNGWFVGGACNGLMRVWDLNERRLVITLDWHVTKVISIKILSGGGKLASLEKSGVIHIWHSSLAKNQPLGTLNEKRPGLARFDNYCEMGVLSSGFLVTCCFSAGTLRENLRIWDPNSLKLVKSHSRISCRSISLTVLADDEIAIGYQAGKVCFFDTNCQLQKTVHLHKDHVMQSVQLDDRYLISASDGEESEIKIWDPASKKLIKTIKTEQSGEILLAFSPDDSLLVTAAEYSLNIWSLELE